MRSRLLATSAVVAYLVLLLDTRVQGKELSLAKPAFLATSDSVWTIETVDHSDDVGLYSSLALDANDHPHVSYLDFTNHHLKYAHYDGSLWLIETVDHSGISGRHTSLALDSTGYPHISYQANRELRYARFDGTVWITKTVDSGDRWGGAGGDSSLALDTAGNPHISYEGWSGPTNMLRYAYFDGTVWHTETLDYDSGSYSSLALDTIDQPHISYYNFWPGEHLRYTHYDGTSWQTETVDGEENTGRYISLALDSTEWPHISYAVGNPFYELRYAYLNAGGWTTQTLDHAWYSTFRHTALAVDRHDYAHVSYYPFSERNLVYTHFDGTAWVSETVDSFGDVGQYNSLALDSTGRPHISYYDYGNGDLKYAHVVCVAIGESRIEGPQALLVNQTTTYEARSYPITTSLPITFTWDNGTVGITATYGWTVTGMYTISVTGTNECGQKHGHLAIQVLEEWPHNFYLPLIVRPH